LRAGRLRHRVQIQSVGSTVDDYGDLSNSWSTDASVWASIVPVGGTEDNIAGELTGVATHSIKMRYRSGVTAQSRIVFDSRTFEIESVKDWNEYKAGKCLEIFCKEVTT
jgi:SPP1 family predicted phage head-tail adaptor